MPLRHYHFLRDIFSAIVIDSLLLRYFLSFLPIFFTPSFLWLSDFFCDITGGARFSSASFDASCQPDFFAFQRVSLRGPDSHFFAILRRLEILSAFTFPSFARRRCFIFFFAALPLLSLAHTPVRRRLQAFRSRQYHLLRRRSVVAGRCIDFANSAAFIFFTQEISPFSFSLRPQASLPFISSLFEPFISGCDIFALYFDARYRFTGGHFDAAICDIAISIAGFYY
jgi:hypothetical protein